MSYVKWVYLCYCLKFCCITTVPTVVSVAVAPVLPRRAGGQGGRGAMGRDDDGHEAAVAAVDLSALALARELLTACHQSRYRKRCMTYWPSWSYWPSSWSSSSSPRRTSADPTNWRHIFRSFRRGLVRFGFR